MAQARIDVATARRKVREGAVRGLAYAARDLGDRAVARTPKLTGALRESERDYVDGENLTATVTYDSEYAVIVHEVARAHAEGQSKFLETALADGADRSLQIIAGEIRRELGE